MSAATPEALNDQFGIPGKLRFEAGGGGLTRAVVDTAQCTGHVYLHGAHVAAWRPADAEPVLWMSGRSHFEDGKPIRGGVPICFPWFGPKADDPDAASHGLARAKPWDFAAAVDTPDGPTMFLATGIHAFAVRQTVTLGETLTMKLTVRNTADEPASFEAALHTYLHVGDVHQVSIAGLEGADYLDKMADGERKNQGDQPIRFEAETDRVYLDTDADCVLNDPALGRSIRIAKTGSRSTVVWNPWTDKAARMADFGDDEWPGMCCIETANVADNAVTLGPDESHEMTVTVAVESP